MQCRLCSSQATYKCIPPKNSDAPAILLCDSHAKIHLEICVYRGESVMQKIEKPKGLSNV